MHFSIYPTLEKTVKRDNKVVFPILRYL